MLQRRQNQIWKGKDETVSPVKYDPEILSDFNLENRQTATGGDKWDPCQSETKENARSRTDHKEEKQH